MHLDAMLFRLATPHDHPVEAFGRSPHRDVGLAVTRLCNRLAGPQVQDLFECSLSRVPLPLGPKDFDAGFTWEASMNQIGPIAPSW